MVNNSYQVGKNLANQVTRNINFDKHQIKHFVCANYIYELIEKADEYDMPKKQLDKLERLLNKVLK